MIPRPLFFTNNNPHPQQYSEPNVRMAPPKSDSRTSPDVSGQESAQLSAHDAHKNPWPMLYNKAAETFDKRALEKINKDMDVLLIFASTF